MSETTQAQIPRHVGLIMDGNGRWAQKRLMPRSAGHSAGMKRMIALAEKAKKSGVRYFTVYALSTENLSRPQEELDRLFSLIRTYFAKNVKKLLAEGAAVRVIGDLTLLPDDVKKIIEEGISASSGDADFTFIIALAYGARSEIVRAARLAAESGNVDSAGISANLYTHGIPDPDLIIRTGGEVRLSNFLLWQAAYAELYFTDVLFPDFSDEEFDKALCEYAHRVRKFGKVNPVW